jgi:NAD(P)-dependent dehydrogenase (short-subunit alcohol dehydrogenase family)
MNGRFDLEGRTAIVTGAAQGLGLAIAEALAEHGARVAMFDLREDAVAEQARRVANGDRETLGLACDTRDLTQVAECVERVYDIWGSIDILVNNAGIHRRGTPVDYRPEDLNDLLATNLVGCYQMAGAVGRKMLHTRRGSIVNVSALGGGLVGLGRGGSMYAMTKGGIVSLTRDLAAEWGPQGVRVNAVAPGWIRTPMTQPLQNDARRSAAVMTRVPLRRWGETKEVAGVVLFLCSDAASYVTGCTIPIDGGAANVIALDAE